MRQNRPLHYHKKFDFRSLNTNWRIAADCKRLTIEKIYDVCIRLDNNCIIYPTKAHYPCIHNGDKIINITEFLLNDLGVDVPSGMNMCHTCDNPKCINLDHIYLGTHFNNMSDKRDRNKVSLKPWIEAGEATRFKKGHHNETRW